MKNFMGKIPHKSYFINLRGMFNPNPGTLVNSTISSEI